MTAVLDPTALTGFYRGYFAISAEDDKVYLVTSSGAIPAYEARGLTTLDSAQLTRMGSDWFILSGGSLYVTTPVTPIVVGDYGFEGSVPGVFHGESESAFLGDSPSTAIVGLQVTAHPIGLLLILTKAS